MNYHFYFIAGATLTCGLSMLLSAQESALMLDPLYVRARSVAEPWNLDEYIVGGEALRNPDAASVLRNLPGAAVVRNGSQTGIVQLRGLSGDRVGVYVDGMSITPACPNHMDPPLHYARLSDETLVEMFAGISPVSAGGDRIGGSLSISRPDPVFSDEGASLFRGKLGGSFMGSQDVAMLSADLAYAQGDAAFEYRGSAATANDLRYPGGTVRDSGYEVTRQEIIAAWRTAGGFISVDGGYSGTRDAGTPALPMDMIKDDAWNIGLAQREKFKWGTLESRFYVHDIDHLMDNYSLRPAAMEMKAPSSSRDYGLKSEVLLPRGDADIRSGIDLHRNEFGAGQEAVATGMIRQTFNENVRSRAGAFVDWEHEWSEPWTTRIGLRGDVVSTDADAVSNAILPPPGPMRDMILSDQAAFNSADRSFTDVMVDAVAALRFTPDESTAFDLAFAIKNRAPSLVERYLWTPLNASAGLADGRTYTGNLDLDPETAFVVALGMEKTGERWNAKLTPFYQTVSDYIQGVPINRMVAGQNVLQFQNIDRAELYGFELAGAYEITGEWSVDASASYVRGRNKDTGGSLYRIAPLHGLIDLSYRKNSWEGHLECVWADSQNDVSTLQDETTSPGYAFFNFRVARTFAKTLRVEVGVENLLDKLYADHLSGVNRVTGGDLDVGERVPGAGRFAYTSVSWKF